MRAYCCVLCLVAMLVASSLPAVAQEPPAAYLHYTVRAYTEPEPTCYSGSCPLGLGAVLSAPAIRRPVAIAPTATATATGEPMPGVGPVRTALRAIFPRDRKPVRTALRALRPWGWRWSGRPKSLREDNLKSS
jgi:hypothetical protein